MAFYVIEKEEQLKRLHNLGDCFIDFILFNDNYHPAINEISLIYLRPLNDHKGYIICLDHSESYGINKIAAFQTIWSKITNLYCINKKDAMYFCPYPGLLIDISFTEIPKIDKITNKCYDFYYSKYRGLKNVNCLIPISKHYEIEEEIFKIVKPIIEKVKTVPQLLLSLRNNDSTNIFHRIEKVGIKIDKKEFINNYNLDYPEYSIKQGRIYSKYNLYTTTGRPANSFNNINFAAINKTNGERRTFIPSNTKFIEFDFQGYHPRLIAKMINYNIPDNENVYKFLGIEKIEMFENIYGGIKEENKYKPFFKELSEYLEQVKLEYQWNGFKTDLRYFSPNEKLNENKLLSYILQARETSENIKQIEDILHYLNNKKTQLVLYTYDAFLFDYSEEDGDIIKDIKQLLSYPVNIKTGMNYHDLTKQYYE